MCAHVLLNLLNEFGKVRYAGRRHLCQHLCSLGDVAPKRCVIHILAPPDDNASLSFQLVSSGTC